MKIVHQIASFTTTFPKKPLLLRGAHPTDTPLRRASARAGAYAPFLTSKNSPPPPHFESRSAAYAVYLIINPESFEIKSYQTSAHHLRWAVLAESNTKQLNLKFFLKLHSTHEVRTAELIWRLIQFLSRGSKWGPDLLLACFARVLSQNYQHFFEEKCMHLNSRWGCCNPVGVLKFNFPRNY